RERLVEYFPGASDFVIFPEGATGISQLDGRPNTAHWSDVVAATNVSETAAGPKSKRRPKVKTVYTTSAGPMTAEDLAALSGKVLYLGPRESATHGDFGATIVHLRSSNQINRLCRLVPNAEPYSAEYHRQRKAAEAAITDADRKWARAKLLGSP